MLLSPIDGDCREHFIQNYQNEDPNVEIGIYSGIAYSGMLGLIKYFNRHPTAAKIILEFMESKKGFKCEKNFYVNLMDLPQKTHFFSTTKCENSVFAACPEDCSKCLSGEAHRQIIKPKNTF